MSTNPGFGNLPELPEQPDLNDISVDQSLLEQADVQARYAREQTRARGAQARQAIDAKMQASRAARDFSLAFQGGQIQREGLTETITFGRGPQQFLNRGYKLHPNAKNFLTPDFTQGVMVNVQTKREDGTVRKEEVGMLPGYQSVLDQLPDDRTIDREQFQRIARALDSTDSGQYTSRLFDPEDLALDPDNLTKSLAALEEQELQRREEELAINARKRFMVADPESYTPGDTRFGQYIAENMRGLSDFSFWAQRATQGAYNFVNTAPFQLATFGASITEKPVNAYARVAHRLGLDETGGALKGVSYTLKNLESKTQDVLDNIERQIDIRLSTADRDSYAYAIGQGLAQMTVQVGAGVLAAPVGLGLLSFAVTGSGFSGAMVYQERQKYYKSAGFVDENGDLSDEGREKALSDGMVAAGITFITERTTGGLGRLVQRAPGLGPMIANIMSRDMDTFAARTLGRAAVGAGAATAIGGVRESVQESMDSVLRRAFLAYYRQDPDKLNDFWSDEYMQQLYKEAVVAFAVGAPTGPVTSGISMMELIKHNPIAVGDQVTVLNYDGTVSKETATKSNLQDVQAGYFRLMRRQQLAGGPSHGGALNSAYLYVVNQINGMANPEEAITFLRRLRDRDGNPVYTVQQLNDIGDAMRANGGAVRLEDLFGDSKTPIGRDVSIGKLKMRLANKVELALVARPLVQFMIETKLISGGKVNKQALIERARAMGEDTVADFFESLDIKTIRKLTSLASESLERVQTREEAALTSEMAGADVDVIANPEIVSEPEATEETDPVQFSLAIVEDRLVDLLISEGMDTIGAELEASRILDEIIAGDLSEENSSLIFAVLEQSGDTENDIQNRFDLLMNEVAQEAAQEQQELTPVVSPEEEVEEEIYEEGQEPERYSRGAAQEAANADKTAQEKGVAQPVEGSRLGKALKSRLADGRVVTAPNQEAQALADGLARQGIKILFVDGEQFVSGPFLGSLVDGTSIYFVHVGQLQQQPKGANTALRAVIGHEAWHTFTDTASDVDIKKAISNAFSGDQDALLSGFLTALASEPELAKELAKLTGIDPQSLVNQDMVVMRSDVMRLMQELFALSNYRWDMSLPLSSKGATNRLLEETMAYYIESILEANPAEAQRMFAEFTSGMEYADVERWLLGVMENMGLRSFEQNFQGIGRYRQIAEILAGAADPSIAQEPDPSRAQEALQKTRRLTGAAVEEMKEQFAETVEGLQLYGQDLRRMGYAAGKAVTSAAATGAAVGAEAAVRGGRALGRGAVAFGTAAAQSVVDSPFGGLASDVASVPQRMEQIFGKGVRKARRFAPDKAGRRRAFEKMLERTRAVFTPTDSDPEGKTRLEQMMMRRRETEAYNERTGTKDLTRGMGLGGKALGIDQEILDAPTTIDEVLQDPRFSRGRSVDLGYEPFFFGDMETRSRMAGLFGGVDPENTNLFNAETVYGSQMYEEGKTVTAQYILDETFSTAREQHADFASQNHGQFSDDTDFVQIRRETRERAMGAIDDLVDDPLGSYFLQEDLLDGQLRKRATEIIDRHISRMQMRGGEPGGYLSNLMYADMMVELQGTLGYTVRADELVSGRPLEIIREIDPFVAAKLEDFSYFAPNQLRNQVVYFTPRILRPAQSTTAGFFQPGLRLESMTGNVNTGAKPLENTSKANLQVTYTDSSTAYRQLLPHLKVVLHEATHQYTHSEMREALTGFYSTGSFASGVTTGLVEMLQGYAGEAGHLNRKADLTGIRNDLDSDRDGYSRKSAQKRLEDRFAMIKLADVPRYSDIESMMSYLSTIDLANSYILTLAAANHDYIVSQPPPPPGASDEAVETMSKVVREAREFYELNKGFPGSSALEFVTTGDSFSGEGRAGALVYGLTNITEYVAESNSDRGTQEYFQRLHKTYGFDMDSKPEPLLAVRDLIRELRQIQLDHPMHTPASDGTKILYELTQTSLYASDMLSIMNLTESRNPKTGVRFSRGTARLWNPQGPIKDQKIGSAGTSIAYTANMPQFMNAKYEGKVVFKAGGTNADIGGGKHDHISKEMKKRYKVNNIVYDPFNRSLEHNSKAAALLRGGQTDTSTVSNVLNTIQYKDDREPVIAQAADAIKRDGVAYFTMYNSGKKGETMGGESYQVAEDATFYMPEIEKYFEEVELVGGKNGVVIARKPKRQAIQELVKEIKDGKRYSRGMEIDPANHYFAGNEVDPSRIDLNLRRTKRFRAAMGESKVKDILYHGTRRKFADPLVLNPAVGQMGIHLSDSPVVAQGFSGRVDNYTHSRVYALYADIRNPVTLPDLLTWNLDSLMDSLETEIKKNYPGKHKDILTRHGSYEGYFDFVAQQYSGLDYMALERSDYMDTEFMQFIIRDLGFDGVRYLNRYEPGISLRNYALAVIRAEPNSSEMVAASNAELEASNALSELKTLMKRQFPKREGRLGASIAGRYIVSDTVIRKAMREFKRKFPDAIVSPDSYSYIAIDAKQLYSAVGDGRMTNDVNIAYSRGLSEVAALTGKELKTVAKKVKRLSVKNLTYQRGVPASVLRKSVEKDGRIGAEIDRATKLNQQVWRGIAKKFRKGSEREQAMGDVNRLLQMPVHEIDTAPTSMNITPDMREIVKSMRQHIDNLSRRIANENDMVSEEMVGVIEDNIGFYMTRRYEAFSDPDWSKKVEPEVRSRMRAALHNAYKDFFEQAAKEPQFLPNGKRNPRHIGVEQRGAVINQLMDDILYRASSSDSPMAFAAAMGDGAANSIFMRRKLVERDKQKELAALDEEQIKLDDLFAAKKIRRKTYERKTGRLMRERDKLNQFDYEGNNELVQAYRAFLGEGTDPMVNYANSVTKMIRSLETFRFNQSLVQTGLKEGFLFYGTEPNRPEGLVPFDNLDVSDPVSPFRGLYATPEMKESIELITKAANNDSAMNPLIRLALRFNSAVKFGKTVLSVETQVRNVVGNLSFMAANGYLTDIFNSGKSIKEAYLTVTAGNGIFGVSRAESQRRYQELLELGVVNTSDFREVEAMWQRGGDGTMEQFMEGLGEAGRLTKKALDGFASTYKAEDDFFKVLAYDIELARLRAAYGGTKSEDAMAVEAAEIVSNTLPNYDRVPEAVKALRNIPFFGTFPSFTSELIRTSIGRINIARAELASDNPMKRKIGQQRVAGMGMMMVLPTILAAAMRSISGVDEEEERAVRGMLPFWNKDSVLLFYRQEGGDLSFVNYGYVDPFVYFRQPFLALLARDDEAVQDRLISAVENIFRPFIGKEIGYSAIYDIVRGQDELGRPLYDPGSTKASQISQAIQHLMGATMPGTVKTVERLILAADGHVDDYGKRYDMGSQIMQLLSGFKFETINPKQAFMFKVSEFNRLDRELRARMNRVARRQGEVSREDLQAAVQYYNGNRRALQKQLFGHVRRMRAFGITDGELRQILQANYISENLSADLVDGTFRPYDIKEGALDKQLETLRFTDRDVPLGQMGEAAVRVQIMRAATRALQREKLDK